MPELMANFAGVIADQQSFLDGARQFTIEGEDQPPTGWHFSLAFRWPVQTERVTEGDLTLLAPDGGELQAVLVDGRAADLTDDDGRVQAGQLDLTFDITGGEGRYAAATGTVHLTGTLAGEGEGTGGSYEGEGVLLTITWSHTSGDAVQG